jgi:hypothetical protein
MNNGSKSLSINETFIVEGENDGAMSACTGFFTNVLVSCTGNTQILLGTGIISANSSFSATTFYGDGSNLTGISTQDIFVTGGTYSAGTAVFKNNTGGTFSVSGFSISNATQFTGGTVTGATFFTNGVTATTISATTYLGLPITNDIYVTGGTYSNGDVEFVNNTGGTFSVTGFSTGYTLTMSAITDTLGYTPISADTFVTGATYSNNTFTYRNNTGGTFNVFFNTMTGLTATTISATTYQNLPIDIRVTGGTHSLTGGTTTFRNNTGGTFSVSGYTKPSDDIYVTGGGVSHGPSNSDNSLTLYRNNAGNVTIDNLVDISEITKSEMNTLISNEEVIQGKTYKIFGCDTSLYYNGTDGKDNAVYTTIYLMGLENDKLTESGVGIFYTPKYSELPIFVDGNSYTQDQNVIWGGYVWNCSENGSYTFIDIFTLDPAGFQIIYPFEGSNSYNTSLYNIQYDDIIYDYTNDTIIYRNEQNSNIVSTTYENIDYWINNMSLYNPIKAFQWGKIYNGTTGIGNQRIINSYNENINYKGLYQTNFYFNNLSYQTDVFVDSENSYQTNFHFENKSYQSNSNIEKASYQDSLYFTTNSYQTDVNIKNGSHQKNITLNNGSYQDSLLLNKNGSYQNNLNFTNGSYQTTITFDSNSSQSGLTFNNGSYQNLITFYDTKGDTPKQQFFNFDNVSYQSNFDIYDIIQSYFEFDNGSYQSGIACAKNQTNFIFDDGSQYNSGNLNRTQQNITIKGFNRDVSGLTVNENGVYFIHDLPTKTTSKLIGKIKNELIEVDNLYYDGSKWVFSGSVSVNTISATTYQNLPLDIRVTGSTKSGTVATFTNNSGTTFTLTGLTDTFVTGGTYDSGTSVITFTNNSGSGFTVTGITASSGSGAFTGGTVTGATIFTSGLTANTISATTYQNLPVSGVTGGTGISADTTNGLVTIVNTSPDQTVTITGGTNIEIDGTYPNFGINFTGSTGASGDFLPLSGGTVTGATIFTSGLTANTISATTIISPSISTYGLIVATSMGYQNIF